MGLPSPPNSRGSGRFASGEQSASRSLSRTLDHSTPNSRALIKQQRTTMAAGASPRRQVTSQAGGLAGSERYKQSHEAWTSSNSGQCSLVGLSTANLRSPTGSGQKAAVAATKLPRPTASGAAVSWPEAETDSARLLCTAPGAG